MAWDIILPEVLFHNKPHPLSISWYHLNLKSSKIVYFHTDTKSSSEYIYTTSIFRKPPEDASSMFLWNNAPQTTYFNLSKLMSFLTYFHLLHPKLFPSSGISGKKCVTPESKYFYENNSHDIFTFLEKPPHHRLHLHLFSLSVHSPFCFIINFY